MSRSAIYNLLNWPTEESVEGKYSFAPISYSTTVIIARPTGRGVHFLTMRFGLRPQVLQARLGVMRCLRFGIDVIGGEGSRMRGTAFY